MGWNLEHLSAVPQLLAGYWLRLMVSLGLGAKW